MMPRLTLRQLLIFAAIAETGSTTTAGVRLSLSQSATSAALNELEKQLGTRLFDRVGRRLLLNETGRALQARARALLDNAMGIERDFGAHVPGAAAEPAIQLRIGASTTIGNYLLPSLLARFKQGWPAADFEVRIGNTQEVTAWVGRLEVDIGLIEGPCHEREIRAEPWIEDELTVVCAPTHPFVRDGNKGRVNVGSLREGPWLLREPGSGTRESVEQALLPHLHQLQEGIRFGSTESIKQAAAAGLGVTCLSGYAVQDLITLGRVLPLKTTLPRLTRRFYLIHHPQKYFSSALQRFMAHCRNETEARTPASGDTDVATKRTVARSTRRRANKAST
jgi:DNA-binding transcriptional LysR family regulator